MVVSSRRDTGGIQAPAVTIAASNPEASNTGWKGKTVKAKGEILRQFCSIENITSLQSCIDGKTYTQKEMISDILMGFEEEKSLMHDIALCCAHRTVQDFDVAAIV